MRSIRIKSARAKQTKDDDFEAICTYELEAVPALCNPIERMHGGAVALLVDMATTMATAPVSSKGFWEFGGVTRTLNITMLQPIPQGAKLDVICKLKSIGKRLCEFRMLSNHHVTMLMSSKASTQCEIKDRTSGKLLAVGDHGKSALSDQDPREQASSRL